MQTGEAPARRAVRKPLLFLLAVPALALAAWLTIAFTSAIFDPTNPEQGVVVANVKNDLSVPVWMAVCEDWACKHPASGGGQIAPGETFPQAVGPDEEQVFLLRGLPPGTSLGSPVGSGPDRCLALTTQSVVLPTYLLSSLKPC